MADKFCKCGEVKTPYFTLGETHYFCPVCDDPFDRAEDRRIDALDMEQEMEVDDDR